MESSCCSFAFGNLQIYCLIRGVASGIDVSCLKLGRGDTMTQQVMGRE